MKKIKSFIVLMKLFKTANLNLTWFKIVQHIMDFATDVQQHGKPMLCKIAVVDMSEEKIVGDFDMVSIWAGVGDANPIERARQVKDQNQFMKKLLRRSLMLVDKERDKDLYTDIGLALETFE